MRAKIICSPVIRLLGVVVAAACIVGIAQAQVYVSPDGNNTTGTSWETALYSLHAAVTQAVARGADVYVAAGTYPVNSSLNIPSNVGVFGGFPAAGDPAFGDRDPVVNVTTLDAMNAATTIAVFESATHARLDGFTLTGSATQSGGYSIGGAVTIRGASSAITVEQCVFEGNHGPYGGGVNIHEASGVIENCTFRDNSAGEGGGVKLHHATATVSRCQFINNVGSIVGGGISAYDSALIVERSIFRGNHADQGGGVECHEGTSAHIVNCLLAGNSATGSHGGALEFAFQRGINITNCTLVDNAAKGYGGGIFMHSSAGAVVNTIFDQCNHQAIFENDTGSDPVVSNCLFFNNLDGVYCNEGTQVITSVGGVAGLDAMVGEASGDLEGDPKFLARGSGDYHLTSASPCVDAGLATGAPSDDLEGRTRPFDLPGVGGDGPGQGYDIGAYECYPGPTITTNDGLDFLTNDPDVTIDGTCPAGMTAVLVNSSPDNVSFVSGETDWSFSRILSEGANLFAVAAVYTNENLSDPATITITLDTIAPGPPVVTAVSPTSDTTPTWTWVSGGGGGCGTFRYQLDGGAWSEPTTLTGYAPATAFNYGETHVLAVQECDLAGNWSSSGTRTVLISKHGDIDNNGTVNAVDVQLVINGALGLDIAGLDADINGDGRIDAIDVQLVINAALGLG